MRYLRMMARGVAMILAALGLLALLGPLASLRQTVLSFFDPTLVYRDPSGVELLIQDAGRMLTPIAALGLAVLIWMIADLHQANIWRGGDTNRMSLSVDEAGDRTMSFSFLLDHRIGVPRGVDRLPTRAGSERVVVDAPHIGTIHAADGVAFKYVLKYLPNCPRGTEIDACRANARLCFLSRSRSSQERTDVA